MMMFVYKQSWLKYYILTIVLTTTVITPTIHATRLQKRGDENASGHHTEEYLKLARLVDTTSNDYHLTMPISQNDGGNDAIIQWDHDGRTTFGVKDTDRDDYIDFVKDYLTAYSEYIYRHDINIGGQRSASIVKLTKPQFNALFRKKTGTSGRLVLKDQKTSYITSNVYFCRIFTRLTRMEQHALKTGTTVTTNWNNFLDSLQNTINVRFNDLVTSYIEKSGILDKSYTTHHFLWYMHATKFNAMKPLTFGRQPINILKYQHAITYSHTNMHLLCKSAEYQSLYALTKLGNSNMHTVQNSLDYTGNIVDALTVEPTLKIGTATAQPYYETFDSIMTQLVKNGAQSEIFKRFPSPQTAYKKAEGFVKLINMALAGRLYSATGVESTQDNRQSFVNLITAIRANTDLLAAQFIQAPNLITHLDYSLQVYALRTTDVLSNFVYTNTNGQFAASGVDMQTAVETLWRDPTQVLKRFADEIKITITSGQASTSSPTTSGPGSTSSTTTSGPGSTSSTPLPFVNFVERILKDSGPNGSKGFIGRPEQIRTLNELIHDAHDAVLDMDPTEQLGARKDLGNTIAVIYEDISQVPTPNPDPTITLPPYLDPSVIEIPLDANEIKSLDTKAYNILNSCTKSVRVRRSGNMRQCSSINAKPIDKHLVKTLENFREILGKDILPTGYSSNFPPPNNQWLGADLFVHGGDGIDTTEGLWSFIEDKLQEKFSTFDTASKTKLKTAMKGWSTHIQSERVTGNNIESHMASVDSYNLIAETIPEDYSDGFVSPSVPFGVAINDQATYSTFVERSKGALGSTFKELKLNLNDRRETISKISEKLSEATKKVGLSDSVKSKIQTAVQSLRAHAGVKALSIMSIPDEHRDIADNNEHELAVDNYNSLAYESGAGELISHPVDLRPTAYIADTLAYDAITNAVDVLNDENGDNIDTSKIDISDKKSMSKLLEKLKKRIKVSKGKISNKLKLKLRRVVNSVKRRAVQLARKVKVDYDKNNQVKANDMENYAAAAADANTADEIEQSVPDLYTTKTPRTMTGSFSRKFLPSYSKFKSTGIMKRLGKLKTKMKTTVGSKMNKSLNSGKNVMKRFKSLAGKLPSTLRDTFKKINKPKK